MRPATQADRLHYRVRRKRPIALALGLLAGALGAPLMYAFPLPVGILLLMRAALVFIRERRATERALIRDRLEIERFRRVQV